MAAGDGSFNGLIYTPWALGQSRALGDYNLKNNFSGEFVYALPFGHGQHFGGGVSKGLNYLIGGWEVTGIVRWRSGFPQSPSEGFNFPTDFFLTGPGQLTANVTSHVTTNVGVAGGIPNLFSNPAAILADIAPVLPGFTGSRNTIEGPAFANVDADIHKSFVMPWSDKQRLQLRVSAYNVFNWANFAGDSLDPTVPALFGQFTSTIGNTLQGARQMEFAARYEF